MHSAFAFLARRWLLRAVVAAVVIAACVPLPVAAAGAFRSASSTTVTTGDPTIARPTGVVDGDALVTVVATRPDTTTIAAPAGWTLLLREDNANTSANSLAVYGKTAASEPTSYSWNLTNANTGSALCMLAFSGIDTTVFTDGLSGQNTPSGFAHATPSITPTYNFDVIVSFHSYASSNSWTPPAGMTEDIDVATLAAPNTAGMSLECNHLLQGFAAATGTLTATTANDANIDAGNAIVLALRSSNAAPVLDTSKSPTLGSVIEDPGAPSGAVGVLVTALANLTPPVGGIDNVIDSDSGAVTGVALVAVDANLTCYYSLNGGAAWSALGAVSNASARLIAADADNRLYCQPNANINGNFASALTFRAWDQSFGSAGGVADASTSGGTTAFSTTTDTISLAVTAVNDAPTATNLSAPETYNEDTTLDLIDIVVADVDNATITATLTLSNTAAGSLTTATSGAVTSTYASGTGVWSASGALADVNALLMGVSFVPAANFNSSFTIASSIDDGNGGTAAGTKAVSGVAVNDAPLLDASRSPTLGTLFEDAPPPSGAVGVLVSSVVDFALPAGQIDNVIDVDTGAALGLAVVANDFGNLSCFYSLNGGVTWVGLGVATTTTARLLAADVDNRLYCQPNANVNGTFAGALTFRAWDQSSGFDGGTADASTSGGATAFSAAADTVSLTVTGVNDAPTATNLSAAETYTEDTAQNLIDIVVADVDNATTTATLTLSNPAAGIFTTATSGAVTSTYSAGTGVWTAAGPIADVNVLLAIVSFVPASNFNGNFTITTSIDDGNGGTATGSKNVTGTPMNDAPLLDPSRSPTLGAVLEDAAAPSGAIGVLVSSLVDFATPAGQVDNVTDVDSGALLGIAVVASDSGNLSCFYSLDGGATWTGLGAVSTATARLLAADADNRLYCRANADLNGNFPGALTFRAWDQTSGSDGGTADTTTSGGASAFSTATDTISLSVTAVNDAPTAVADVIALNQGATATTLVGGASSVLNNDVDVDGPSLAAQLVTPPAHATVFFLNADGSFQYTQDNSNTNVDSFVYRACDGATPSLCSANTSVSIGVNLRPVAGCTVPGQLLSEGDAVSINLSGMFVDPEAQALSFSAVGLPAGLGMNSAGLVVGAVAAGAQTGSPYLATITAQDPGAAATSRQWGVQVLGPGELVFRNGFDNPADAAACH